MKITTKTGDKGETSLFGGRRVSKSCDFIVLVGELDELQAVVGWAAVRAGGGEQNCVHNAEEEVNLQINRVGFRDVMERVVDDIYRMMSVVGFEMKCPGNIKPIGEEDVEFLEKEMAKYEEVVGDLNKFVRPGGSEISARLHIARTVCRRVERGMVGMTGGNVPEIAGEMLKYLNRLSDLLFVMAIGVNKNAMAKPSFRLN